jgi:putative flippase GtrA
VKVSRPATDDLCVQVSGSPASQPMEGGLRARLQPEESATLVGRCRAYARAHAMQLVHFIGVGLGMAALNLSLLYVFRSRLHWPDPVAVTAMYTLGTVPHFVYHRWITYHVQDRPLVPQGLRYIGMLITNFVIMQLLVALAARLSVSPYIAVVTSAGCTMIANFLLMTHVVFARRQRD